MNTLRKVNFFNQLNDEELNILDQIKEIVHLKKDAVFIKEEEKEDSFYVIAQGSIIVEKRSGHKNHLLTELHAGECIGEMVLVDESPRSASAMCATDCILYKFDTKKLKSDPRCQTIVDKILKKINYETVLRLRNTNVVAADALKDKLIMGTFFIRTLITLSIYTLSLNLVKIFKNYFNGTTIITSCLLLTVTLVMLSIIRASGYSFSYYGLSTKNARKNIIQAILYTLPILLIISLAKWMIIRINPVYHQLPLFDFSATMTKDVSHSHVKYFLYMFLYALFCPIQEFIFRGCIQTSLQHLLNANKGWPLCKTIIISNLIFASVHSHLTIGYALGAFIPGLFWGWLYAKQRTLVGVSVSHILIGVCFAFILRLQLFLK